MRTDSMSTRAATGPAAAPGSGHHDSRDPDRTPATPKALFALHPRLALAIALPAIPAALIALILSLWLGGAAASSALGDPGALTRWGLPIARLVHDGALTLTAGCLLFACTIVPRTADVHRRRRGEKGADPVLPDADEKFLPAYHRLLTVASVSAAVWTLAAAAVALLTYSDAAATPLSVDPTFTSGLGDFLVNFDQGRCWVAVVLLAALTTTLAMALRSYGGLAFAFVTALAALVPLALTGHASGAEDHMGAVNSLGLHLLGVVGWAGGLGALAVIAGLLGGYSPSLHRKQDKRDRHLLAADVLSRFSALAGASIVVVIGSGIAAALIRVHHIDQLATGYGIILLLKTFGALLLGLLGLVHRRSIIPALQQGRVSARRAAWRVVAVEAAIMAAIMGLASSLARTQPPVSDQPPAVMSPARRLTNYELPPELGTSQWFTVWRPDWLWIAFIVFLGVAYTRWFVRLRRRGDKWPVWRLMSMYVGLLALFYITSGAPAVYGMVLFSAHMLDHMSLTMVAPIFMVMGSPIALALRAMRPRTDGTRGPREWTLTIVHSGYARFITNPIFAGVNFAGSIVIFYQTDIFQLALRYHLGHELMNAHFLIAGYLFAVNMIGLDPLPHRTRHFNRLILLLATVVFHAFFAVAIMGTDVLIQPDWFGNMGRTWGLSAIEDQKLGAGAMWGIGEVPTLILAVGVAVEWSRSDERAARRQDRQADRSGDAELKAYNEMFAQLAAQDRADEATPRR